MISKEFFKQLEIVADEKGVSLEQLIDAFKKGLIMAYKKTYGNTSVLIEFKIEKCEILMFSQHLVVEKKYDDPENEMPQMLLSDALKISSRYHVGDIIELPISPKDFGRLATETAKSVFKQSLRNLEKDNAFNYFKKYENEMINAEVIAANESFITLNVGRGISTLLPVRELLPNDKFQVGDLIKVYIVNVEATTKGPKVYVSRGDKNLVTRLMESIIPEISDGTIEIMGIARDAGDRCKIAVYSKDNKVDAIGSCVGEGGQRIKEIVQSLNGEKIDLYKWSKEPMELIANSLQPSDVIAVINIDVKEKSSLAIVPDDQLSLAIGKSGQNVRLAVQSCGWKIDIKSQSDAKKEGIRF